MEIKQFGKFLIAAITGISICFMLTEATFAATAVRDHRTNHNEGQLSLETQRIKRQLVFKIPKNMQEKSPVIQWTFKANSKGRPVLSGNHYQLVNMAVDRGLKRQKRVLAANLGFLPSSSNKFNMLVRREKGGGQVRYGDIVALNLKPYGWLRYKKQGYGINISDDDNNPHFIWQILGGEIGTNLLSGMPFALHNTTPEKEEVIFCQRTHGIDLGWYPSSKCGGFMSELSGTLFGANGLLSGEGYSGNVIDKMKSFVCEAAVGASAAYITAKTAGGTTAAVIAAVPLAIKECEKL